jgi:hypothetical protein
MISHLGCPLDDDKTVSGRSDRIAEEGVDVHRPDYRASSAAL